MNFSLYIAKRYLFSKASKNAINIITLIATFGVVVGSLALFIILSGFSGLRTFSLSLLNASDPDIKISPSNGKSFYFNENLENILLNDDQLKFYSRVIEERAFIQFKDKSYIAYIKGVDNNYNQIIPINSKLSVGTWLDNDYLYTAVIGNGISYKLSLGIHNFGEYLQIKIPKPGKGFINPNNAFESIAVQVVGVYNGYDDFQNKYVFTDYSLAKKLLNYKNNQVSEIEIKLKNPDFSDKYRNFLQKKIGTKYKVQTRQQLNSLLYKVINTENFVSYLIFTLIVIIALFNVIGAIIMIIIDKKHNLTTLFNLGANLKSIKKIFVLQGFLLTIVGLTIGLIIGVILVFIQNKYSFVYLIPNVPYPIEFRFTNLIIVIITISILGYIASLIASSRINKNYIKINN